MANEKDNEFIRAMEEHKYDNIEQNHITHNFYKLLAKDYLIFNWSAIEKKTNKNIQGILLYKPNLIFSSSSNINAFKKTINNFISMKYNTIKMDDNSSIYIISVFVDNKFYKQFQNIKGIEIFINNIDKKTSQKYKWIGLQKYFLSNVNNNSDNIEEIQFTCMIKEKGIYDLNKISLAIHYIISKKKVDIINNILSPIFIKVD